MIRDGPFIWDEIKVNKSRNQGGWGKQTWEMETHCKKAN